MEEKIERIDIVPAVFIKYREDGNVLLKCLQGDETVDRAFEPRLFKNIEDIKYILIGVMSGVGMMRITIADGSEFENLFHEKWKILIK